MNDIGLNTTDRKFAVLIDPDEHTFDSILDVLAGLEKVKPDYILIGGSLVVKSNTSEMSKLIAANSNIPLVLFPGHFTQLNEHVDHILLLSLISGRNPDLLIGQHVLAAPALRSLKPKISPTGYILIDGGKPTSVSYMSNTTPIPADKPDIAACTAIAGESLGMRQIYLDAGSGAEKRIEIATISAIKAVIDIPLIVGGGVRKVSHIIECWNAGANLVVIGNGIEDQPELLDQLQSIRADRLKQSF